MQWTIEQTKVISSIKIGCQPSRDNLKKILLTERRYKCFTCSTIFGYELFKEADDRCPNCNDTHSIIMCPIDHNKCTHTTPMASIANCPICGDAMCPECGTHDVMQISRVTGYLQDVGGWNNAKRQELKDRSRTTIEDLI